MVTKTEPEPRTERARGPAPAAPPPSCQRRQRPQPEGTASVPKAPGHARTRHTHRPEADGGGEGPGPCPGPALARRFPAALLAGGEGGRASLTRHCRPQSPMAPTASLVPGRESGWPAAEQVGHPWGVSRRRKPAPLSQAAFSRPASEPCSFGSQTQTEGQLDWPQQAPGDRRCREGIRRAISAAADGPECPLCRAEAAPHVTRPEGHAQAAGHTGPGLLDHNPTPGPDRTDQRNVTYPRDGTLFGRRRNETLATPGYPGDRPGKQEEARPGRPRDLRVHL